MIKRNSDNVFAIATGNQCHSARSAAVSLCPGSGGGGSGGGGVATRIPRASAVRMTPPDAQHNTKEANIALSTYVEKWKNRYEDAERKHKAYLLKSEKAKREYDDLQRRHNILAEERNHLERELRERERELTRLKQVSEKLFLEYQQLRNQHEVDAGVMHKVMQQAGEWYKQNKQLKRRSTVLMQALPAKGIDIDFTDSTDTASDSSSNEEVEFLKQTVQELSGQIASLQTELNNAKLQEFEAQEANVALTQEVETLQERCKAQDSEITELRRQLERLERVSGIMVEEVKTLKENADKDRQMAETYKSEALAANLKLRSLSRQSAVFTADLAADHRLMALQLEIEQLTAALQEQEQRHREQIDDLQFKLTEKNEETDILLWDEKIRLAEEDAQKAIERAEKAERKLAELNRQIKQNVKVTVTSDTSPMASDTSPMAIDRSPTTGDRSPQPIEVKTNKLTSDSPTLPDDRTPKVSNVTPNNKPQVKKEILKPKKSNLMSRISYFENGCSEKGTSEIEEKVEQKTDIVEEIKEDVIEVVPEEKDEVSEEKEVIQEVSSPATVAPVAVAPPPPICPPPPPPPPPPLPPVAFVSNNDGDMATLLASKQGTLKKCAIQNGGGAIDAIVDQIKGGKFHLKSTDRSFSSRPPREEQQPEAVKEMLAILGTLRKRRVTRHSTSEA